MFKIKFVLMTEEEAGSGSSGVDNSAEGFDMSAASADIAASLGLSKISGDNDEEAAEDDSSTEEATTAKTSVEESKDSTAEEEESSSGDDDEAAAEVDSAEGVKAPKTWKAEAAKQWDKVPEAVKTEVLRREANMFDGIEQYKHSAALGDQTRNILAPFEADIRSRGGEPLAFVKSMLEADKSLRESAMPDRIETFRQLASEYGVVLSGENLVAEDSAVNSLRSEVQRLQSHLDAKEAQTQEAEKARINKEISEFASDPANPHFEAVANDIAALIRSGVTSSLSEAYEKAVWANPVTRALEQTRLQTEAAKKQEAAAKAEAAKRKKLTAVNARSSGSPKSTATPLGSMDDTLAAKFAEIQARS